jgi:hypothetical protein
MLVFMNPMQEEMDADREERNAEMKAMKEKMDANLKEKKKEEIRINKGTEADHEEATAKLDAHHDNDESQCECLARRDGGLSRGGA